MPFADGIIYLRAVLFTISNGHMVMPAYIRADTDLNRKMSFITDAFMKEYEN